MILRVLNTFFLGLISLQLSLLNEKTNEIEIHTYNLKNIIEFKNPKDN